MSDSPATERRPSRAAVPVSTAVLTLAGVVIALAGLKAVASIMAPALLALFLVITFRPLAAALERRRVPSWITMIITLVLIYGVLIFLSLSIYLSVTRFALILIASPDEFNALIGRGTQLLSELGIQNVDVSQLASLFSPARIATLATSLVSASAAVASAIGLILALAFFMALDATNFSTKLKIVTRFRPETAEALVGLGRSTRSYFAVAAAFGAIVAVIDWVLLLIIGVPDAWLWAVLAFVTNFIPNIGFLIGVIPPAVLALVVIDWQAALIVFAGYCVINVVVQVLIQPKVVGDRVQLNTTLTFLALIVWTFVLGGLGAILAIPMTLLVRALFIDTRPELRWVRTLFSSPDSPKKSRNRRQRPSAGGSSAATASAEPKGTTGTAGSADEQPPAPAPA